MIKTLRLLMLLIVPIGLYAQGQDGRMETPKSLIESGAVTRVLIFHVSDSISTRVAVAPEALLSMAGSSFEISTDIKERLKPVFSRLSFQKEKRTPDLRWGVLFYDVHNREIGSVFVDKFGQYGYVNKEAGNFENDKAGFNIAKELHKLTDDPR